MEGVRRAGCAWRFSTFSVTVLILCSPSLLAVAGNPCYHASNQHVGDEPVQAVL